MEQNKYAISVAVGGRITNPYVRSDWITNPVEQIIYTTKVYNSQKNIVYKKKIRIIYCKSK